MIKLKCRSSTMQCLAEVMRVEASAILKMVEEISDDYLMALELILNVRGRLIVSGIGKSGHIGRKIAATFASTGTPAQFVHSAEASHGDLGVITSDDACLVISNSGETSELADLIRYCRRFDVPLIAITREPRSSLALQSNVVLRLPSTPEACPIGVTPTSSTTATLALGDALAVALMKERGFSHAGFRSFHPGGKLGSLLTPVSSIMHTGDSLPVLSSNTAMAEGILVMTAKGFGIAAVVDEGRLVGVITDGDLRRNLSGLLEKVAVDVATRQPTTVGPDVMVSEALRIMNKSHISALLVVDDSKLLLGVVHLHDCLRVGAA